MGTNKNIIINDKPLHSKGRVVRMAKPYSEQNYQKPTVLSDDVFTFVSFYYASHGKTMKYKDSNLRQKYGNPKQYGYEFYWKQAETFYKAAKLLPIETSPVASYYCMLNAVKSYLSYSSKYVDDFVCDFALHGLSEDHSNSGDTLLVVEKAL